MPFGAVDLVPGVNVERTPTLNRAGYSQTQLGRFKDSLFQKLGGWNRFYPFNVSGTPRALHPWQDLNENAHLAVGTTTQLAIITGGTLQPITPQTIVSNFAPDFSTTAGDTVVNIVDPNISDVTTFDSIYFNTPVSVGGIILAGLYPINQITGTHSYNIVASRAATSTVANGGVVPVFTTIADSSAVQVTFPDHGLSVGNVIVFPIPTTINATVIEGAFPAITIIDADNFAIQALVQAATGASAPMNGGDAQLVYYISIGPQAIGVGYGLGGYGEGGYGTGIVPTAQTGTPITTADWTLDNWGQLLIACPQDGGIYYFDPTGGFSNTSLVTSGPPFNGGIFVSTTEQILIAWGSTVNEAVGQQQDPMLVQWSDSGNFLEWNPTNATMAGNYRIPIGSEIRGGMAVSNQNLIWTDLDLWAMNFVGQPFVFGFNKIGAGAGLASSHAAQQLRGNVYWMGLSNFYVYGGGGVQVIPCPVWDAVFQNLNMEFVQNVRALPNTPFNEVGWAYPSTASLDGECDSYVKMNITDPSAPWDYGSLARSAWCDLSVLGPPIGATPGGLIYQHETSPDADGQPLMSSFTTGYFYVAEGEEYAFIDQVLPDFKYGTFGGSPQAQIQLTFNMIDYTGDTPRTYGPYTATAASKFLSTRMRGRQMSVTISSSDTGSFWRIGHIRYRYSIDGRR